MVGSQSEEVLKDVGQTFRVDRLAGASQLVDRPPPMSDDRGLLHVGPSHVGEGIAGSPDQKVGLLLVVGVSFEGPIEPAGKESGPQDINVESCLLGGLPNGCRFESLAVLDGTSNGKPNGRLVGEGPVDAAEKQDAVVGIDQQDLRAEPSDRGHQPRIARDGGQGRPLIPLTAWVYPCPSAARWSPQAPCETLFVPLVDVTHDDTIDERRLRRLAELLPEIVAEAVDCPEEQWIGPPGAGDLEIRFRRKRDLDVGELNVVVEVRTKLLDSRFADKQRRADLIRDRLAGLQLGATGVWLILAEGAWSQS